MDWANLGRELFTAFCVTTFAVVSVIAYSKSSKKRYQEAANMIVDDNDDPEPNADAQPSNGAK
jgi:cytochrome c oxidase cbb3-type subunit 4